MSRVGKHAVKIPSDVSLTQNGQKLEVSGKLGKLSLNVPEIITIENQQNSVLFVPKNQSDEARSLWGTAQRNFSNMVKGVSEGFTVNLNLVGVGYKAAVQGSNVVIQLGFSHDVVYPIPEGVFVTCEKPTHISIKGACKQHIGQIAAEIRNHRRAEPYKGKGVIRDGEFVVRKEGKKK